jgi:hypothetical protein
MTDNETRAAPARADGAVMAVGYVAALAPLLLAIVLTLLASGFAAPSFDNQFMVAGMPVGLALLSLVAALTAIGVLVVRVLRSWLAVVVVVVLCVIPALFILVFGPAVILIAINLGT